MDKQRLKYEELMKQIQVTIAEIDEQTPWQNSETNWWLNMMDLQRFVFKQQTDEN